MKPFHFVTAVWGKTYTKIFINITLPSLLSEGNIPVVSVRRKCYYIIYTTTNDECIIKESNSYKELMLYASVKFERLISTQDENKYKIASDCYLAASKFISKAGHIVVYIIPDAVSADGGISKLSEIFEEGIRAVLICNIRLIKENIVPQLDQYREKNAINVKPRELTQLAIDHIHPIMKNHMFDDAEWEFHPSFFIWPVEKRGFILYNVHPQPFAIDLDGIDLNFTSTIDDDLLGQLNLPQEHIRMINDSDDILFFELSEKEQKIGLPATKSFLSIIGWMESATNCFGRSILRRPVFVHTSNIDMDPHWEEIKFRSELVIQTLCNLFELNKKSNVLQVKGQEGVLATDNDIERYKLIAYCSKFRTVEVFNSMIFFLAKRSENYLNLKRRPKELPIKIVKMSFVYLFLLITKIYLKITKNY